MPNDTNEKRVFQFAYTLLDANVPSLDVYQECISFIQAANKQANKTPIFIYEITPEIMEQAAQAVSKAHAKLDETRWALATRAKPNRVRETSEAENFLTLETKA